MDRTGLDSINTMIQETRFASRKVGVPVITFPAQARTLLTIVTERR